MIYIAAISFGVVRYIACICRSGPTHRGLLESQDVEFAWTALPCLVLIAIALPSLRLLYIIDEAGAPRMTLKAVGHQWY